MTVFGAALPPRKCTFAEKITENPLTIFLASCIMSKLRNGSIAQPGEHLPYKQGVTGSSPVVPTNYFVTGKEICLSTIIIILHSRRAELEKFEVIFFNGRVVQLVRTLACHARGRGFEPHSGRHCFASVAQSVEQRTENPRVDGSIPSGSTKCGFSSSGRAPPCQGGGSEFEPRNPLQKSPYDE